MIANTMSTNNVSDVRLGTTLTVNIVHSNKDSGSTNILVTNTTGNVDGVVVRKAYRVSANGRRCKNTMEWNSNTNWVVTVLLIILVTAVLNNSSVGDNTSLNANSITERCLASKRDSSSILTNSKDPGSNNGDNGILELTINFVRLVVTRARTANLRLLANWDALDGRTLHQNRRGR
jgi:hypothetical protein